METQPSESGPRVSSLQDTATAHLSPSPVWLQVDPAHTLLRPLSGTWEPKDLRMSPFPVAFWPGDPNSRAPALRDLRLGSLHPQSGVSQLLTMQHSVE